MRLACPPRSRWSKVALVAGAAAVLAACASRPKAEAERAAGASPPAADAPAEAHGDHAAHGHGHGGGGKHGHAGHVHDHDHGAAPADSGPGGTPAAPPDAPVAHRHPHADHRFDDAEKWAKVFDDPARDAWQKPEVVVRLLALAPGMSVADVGAGTGYFLPRLAAAVGQKGRVLGLDVEDAMVAYMTKRAERAGLLQVVAKKVAADDPGLGERSVDRVLVVDTWHHLGDRRAYSAKLARALAPGGFVLVVDFKKESRRGPPAEAKLTPDEVIADLAAGGLTALLVDGDPLPDQFVVIGRK